MSTDTFQTIAYKGAYIHLSQNRETGREEIAVQFADGSRKPARTLIGAKRLISITRVLPIPASFPVQPLKPGQEAQNKYTCGHCRLSWDDSIPTFMTPAPSARCPFEAFHLYPEA